MATWCLRAGRCDNHEMLMSYTIDNTKVTCSDVGSNTFAVGSTLLIFSFTDSTACAPAARSADATQRIQCHALATLLQHATMAANTGRLQRFHY